MLQNLRRTATATGQALRQHGLAARRDTGKTLTAQAIEMLRLRYGVGKLAPDEYYQYRLYDDARFSWEAKQRFLGRSLENGLIPFLRATPWVGLANDKLIAETLFKGLGFPTPHSFAVYHPYRGHGDVPVLRAPDAMAAFIRNGMPFPFVAKPVTGMWGRDVWVAESIDNDRQTLHMKSGERIGVDEYVSRLSPLFRNGVLFQTLLMPHPVIAVACGPRICSVRMVVIVEAEGARFVETLWKVATGTNMADNYWAPGNLVGPIETRTGVVGRMLTGLGRQITDVARHPDTGVPLEGLQLPDWSEATALCLAAAAALPGIPLQAWDIALTDAGPTLLEVNVNGGMRLPQLVRQAGLYSGDVEALLNRRGYPPRRRLARWFSQNTR